eukprot:12890703-Prorocentrum_lima.AAC.1
MHPTQPHVRRCYVRKMPPRVELHVVGVVGAESQRTPRSGANRLHRVVVRAMVHVVRKEGRKYSSRGQSNMRHATRV